MGMFDIDRLMEKRFNSRQEKKGLLAMFSKNYKTDFSRDGVTLKYSVDVNYGHVVEFAETMEKMVDAGIPLVVIYYTVQEMVHSLKGISTRIIAEPGSLVLYLDLEKVTEEENDYEFEYSSITN